MDSTHADRNLNSNNNQMEEKLGNCTDNKACVDEIVSSRAFIYKEPCNMDNKQGSIYNYGSMKNENIDDLTVRGTDLITDCGDDKACLNETVISRGYIKQEPFHVKIEQESIGKYLSIKDENIDDLTVTGQETEPMTDHIDNKVCVYETIISGGYIKKEPCDMKDEQGSIHNHAYIKHKNIDDLVVEENYLIRCEGCGEEYDLYCLKCPMLSRILDGNNSNWENNRIRRTLPKDVLDIFENLSGLGIVALRDIPKGVVFGPFQGLDSIKDGAVSKWGLKNNELACTRNPKRLNWMQYIRRADQGSHQNLIPFQYEGGLYYRSDCHICVGDELLVCWNSGGEENDIEYVEDSYFKPEVCERLDEAYACTLCCVGYKSLSHLEAHNPICPKRRNGNDFCKEIVQCDICKIYLNKKEYSDHMDQCCKSNERSNSKARNTRSFADHNEARSFACTLCSYKARTKSCLKQHMAFHNPNDKPFACTLCQYKATTKSNLQQHMAFHNTDRPFACTLCSYRAKTQYVLKQHFVTHKGDRPFACTLCSYKAKTNSHLRKHVIVHSNHRPFACTLCPYNTALKSALKRHVAIHSADKPFKCTFCPYKTTAKSILKKHIVTHNGDRPFACTLCPYKATTKSALKLHVAIHSADKPFACTICPYKAKTQPVLKQHIATHNGDRPLACSLCPYRTTNKSTLKRHIAVHHDNRPFACTVCPHKAKTKLILKRHIVAHSDDRPFTCTLCPFKAKTNAILKAHIATHNDYKPFACALCPYKAKKNWILQRHITTHSGDKVFGCSFTV